MRTARLVIPLVALAALGCSMNQPMKETTNEPRKDVAIQFTSATINPQRARVLAGGGVTWLNYSMGYVGAVYFPESIRESFTCDELRPMFSQVAGGYRSLYIRGDTESVALPCPLKPGSYDYELRLYEGTESLGPGYGAPIRTLSGTLVFE